MCILDLIGTIPKRAKPTRAMSETPVFSDSDVPNVQDIFAGCNTLVHFLDGTKYALNCKIIDENVAANLLDAKMDSLALGLDFASISPVELRYLHSHPDLKMYALRSRVMLPKNESLETHHNIAEKGPVVVFRLDHNLSSSSSKMNSYQTSTYTKRTPIAAPKALRVDTKFLPPVKHWE